MNKFSLMTTLVFLENTTSDEKLKAEVHNNSVNSLVMSGIRPFQLWKRRL